MMGWLTTIVNVITAIPKILELVGQLFRSWNDMKEDKKEKESKDAARKEEDDLRSGNTPRS